MNRNQTSAAKRKLTETPAVGPEKKSRADTNGHQLPLVSDLWVDKYRPTSTKQIIGQQGDKSCVNKLIRWLANWHNNLDKKPAFGRFGGASDEGQGFRAALLSGQPGVGKTTTAHLVCKELGYDFVELNASDARSKRTLDEVVKELTKNTSLSSYFSAKSGQSGVTSKHVVIMDEVDGMAGNEDRGGIAELIQLIKTTKIPIICICNDRSHQKMRSLVNYCFDLRFFRPRVEQIKGPMMSIAYKEGISMPAHVLHELIVSSNQDIRQVLHNMSLLSIGHKRVDNLLSEQSIKDVKLGPFDAVRKVFSAGEEYAKMSFMDKSDLFFCDYSLMPLMNFENYCQVKPNNARSEAQKLSLAAKSIEAMAFGDIIEKQIRSTNNWSLLPLQAAFASVMPGAYMSGHMGGQINFPSFMGRLSTTNKRNRLLQELKMHMNLKVSGSKTALNLDYLEPLRDAIIQPLVTNGTGGVPNSIEKMEHYCLRREDIESITELTLWRNQKDPMSGVDSKVKAALTRAYNKEGFCLPYSLGTVTKGKKGKAEADDEFGEGIDGGEEAVETAEEDDDIEADAMIKAKKKPAKKNQKASDSKETKQKAKTSKATKKSEPKDNKRKPKEEIVLEKEEKKVIPKEEQKPQKDEKKKKKRVVVIDSDSDSEPEVEVVTPKKKAEKKVVKVETESPRRTSPRKSAKTVVVEPEVKPKTTPKKTPKKEVIDVEEEEEIIPKSKRGKKSQENGVSKRTDKTKAEPKSETKTKKTPDNKKSPKGSQSGSQSKGKQMTLNSFFTRK